MEYLGDGKWRIIEYIKHEETMIKDNYGTDTVTLRQRLRHLTPRKPDFIIGTKERPYIRRWWLTPRADARWKTYLHNIMRDDDDRALHDHPCDNISIVVWGGYIEHLPGGKKKMRRAGHIVFRKAEQAHRIELRKRKDGTTITAWTIFIFAKKRREWGFHCPNGWRHWTIFTDPKNPGAIGPGCGE